MILRLQYLQHSVEVHIPPRAVLTSLLKIMPWRSWKQEHAFAPDYMRILNPVLVQKYDVI